MQTFKKIIYTIGFIPLIMTFLEFIRLSMFFWKMDAKWSYNAEELMWLEFSLSIPIAIFSYLGLTGRLKKINEKIDKILD